MRLDPRALLPTPTWLRLSIVPVLAFIATVSDHNYLADFWHHLARGRAIVESGTLVDHDLFTFTVAGQPFQDVNWLTQVGYYWLFDLGGLDLVQVANSVLVAVTLGWLVYLCRRRTGSDLAAVIAGAIAFFGVWEVLTIRPQTLSMLLFVIVYDLLERSERRPWLLLVPPALVGLWANVHGAFPAGIMMVGCFALAAWCRRWMARRLMPDGRTWGLGLCLVGCVLATAVNPYGWTIYRYVGGTSSIAYQRQIAEWVAPGPDRLIGLMWLTTVPAVLGLIGWRWWQTRQMPAVRDVLLLGCFLALSAGSARMVAWWMLVSAPIVAELLVWLVPRLAVHEEDAGRPSPAAGGVFTLVALAVLFSLPGLDRYNPLLGATRRGPRVEDDLEAVHRHLAATGKPGRIYAHFEWGEYLSWSAGQRSKVFMDGRIEIYPDEVWNNYSDVTCARDRWHEVLDRYAVDYLILDTELHGRSGLLERVRQSPGWQQAFASRRAVLFVRTSAGVADRSRVLGGT
jgi:drug/metabolite transporter superfamily protein YnfA